MPTPNKKLKSDIDIFAKRVDLWAKGIFALDLSKLEKCRIAKILNASVVFVRAAQLIFIFVLFCQPAFAGEAKLEKKDGKVSVYYEEDTLRFLLPKECYKKINGTGYDSDGNPYIDTTIDKKGCAEYYKEHKNDPRLVVSKT